MRFIMEYIGMTFISVAVGGALFYLFVTSPDSGLVSVGKLAGQETAKLSNLGVDQIYGEKEMDQQITFSYREKTYTAGLYENLQEQFSAKDPGGQEIPVRVWKVISSEGEVCDSDEEGVLFPAAGVYTVYAMAGGACYRVTVPVMAAGQGESAA